jgi:YaiO family outer membrane protein
VNRRAGFHGRGRPAPAGCLSPASLPSREPREHDVDSFASVEKYFDWLSLSYSLNTAKVSDISDPHFGHLLRAAHEYGEGSRVALVVGFGEEAETVAPGVIQVTDTQSVSLAGLHWTSTAWGISWEAGWYEQGDLYDRIRVRVGVEHRF